MLSFRGPRGLVPETKRAGCVSGAEPSFHWTIKSPYWLAPSSINWASGSMALGTGCETS